MDEQFACAVFTPCQQSFSFEQRRIFLGEEPVKIGRAVAKLKPAHDNAIFDCKVLSRNHAIVWYEDGNFYIKDTNSSNGTYLNNTRLSNASEESEATQIFSGDIIQFGVDIVENSTKTTHGCIIAMVHLYHPYGEEVAFREGFDGVVDPETPSTSSYCESLNFQELYQLRQYITEANTRQQVLESKLVAMQALVTKTQQASENCWQALIDEDRLLSKIEILEKQLSVYTKNMSEDELRLQIKQLFDEKAKYETTAKESLRRVLQEKLEAVQRLADVERCLEATGEECSKLKKHFESKQRELASTSEQHSRSLQRIEELEKCLKEAELRYRDIERQVNSSKQDMKIISDSKLKQEALLNAQLESLRADYDEVIEVLAAMEAKVAQIQNGRESGNDEGYRTAVEEQLNRKLKSRETRKEVIRKSGIVKELSEKIIATQKELDACQQQLRDSRFELDKSQKRVIELNAELDEARQELKKSNAHAQSLEDMLIASDNRLGVLVEQAVSDIMTRFEEIVYQKLKNEELVTFLKEQIHLLESKLKVMICVNHSQRMTLNGNLEDLSLSGSVYGSDKGESIADSGIEQCDRCRELCAQLSDALKAHEMVENQLTKYRDECQIAKLHYEQSAEEKENLSLEVQRYQKQLSLAISQVEALQSKLALKEAKCERLDKELRSMKSTMDETVNSPDKAKPIDSTGDIEPLLNGVKTVAYELSLSPLAANGIDTVHHQLQNVKPQGECISLKQECDSLRKYLAATESVIKTSKLENERLKNHCSDLRRSIDELKEQNRRLTENESSYRYQVECAKCELETFRNKLSEANEKLMNIQLYGTVKERESLTPQPSDTPAEDTERDDLLFQMRIVCLLSVIPLFVLLVACLMAFLPSLSNITGTADGPLYWFL